MRPALASPRHHLVAALVAGFGGGWRAPATHWHVEVQEEDGKRRVTVRDHGLAEHEGRIEANPPEWAGKRSVKVVACWKRCLGFSR